MIRAIIFDVDNTLIDFYRMKQLSISEAIDSMIDAGLNMEKNKAMKIIQKLFQEIGMESHDLYQRFSKKAMGKVEPKLIAAAIVAHKRVWSSFLHPYPGVLKTLISLKNHNLKLGVVSDAPRLHAYERLAGMHLLDFFDVVITHDDTHQYKPAKKPFQLALTHLNQEPENCLMVGDWVKGDIQGAKALGMVTCLAKYGAPSKETRVLLSPSRFKKYKIRPHYTLNRFEELIGIIGRLNG